jgi:hypothetical protein
MTLQQTHVFVLQSSTTTPSVMDALELGPVQHAQQELSVRTRTLPSLICRLKKDSGGPASPQLSHSDAQSKGSVLRMGSVKQAMQAIYAWCVLKGMHSSLLSALNALLGGG